MPVRLRIDINGETKYDISIVNVGLAKQPDLYKYVIRWEDRERFVEHNREDGLLELIVLTIASVRKGTDLEEVDHV